MIVGIMDDDSLGLNVFPLYYEERWAIMGVSRKVKLTNSSHCIKYLNSYSELSLHLFAKICKLEARIQHGDICECKTLFKEYKLLLKIMSDDVNMCRQDYKNFKNEAIDG